MDFIYENCHNTQIPYKFNVIGNVKQNVIRILMNLYKN